MSEISDAIWRIVEPRIIDREGLGDAVKPSRIRARRGIAYIDNTGSISTKSGSEASGGDEAGAPGAEQETDPESASRDAGDPGASGSDNGDSIAADAVDDSKKGDQIKDITGNDYTSGSDDGSIKVKLNSIDDAARDNPGGWPDPDSPPTVSDWVSGQEWRLGGAASAAPDFATKSQVRAWAAANLIPDGYAEFGNDTQWFKSGGDWNGEGRSTYNWDWFSCTPTPGDPTCPTVAPVDDWPADGQCHLSWDTASGTFKGNAYDSDCSGAQISGTAEVYIEDGGIRKKISHLANGGFKITDVDGSNVDDPAGYTRIYSADGILESITTTGVGGQVE